MNQFQHLYNLNPPPSPHPFPLQTLILGAGGTFILQLYSQNSSSQNVSSSQNKLFTSLWDFTSWNKQVCRLKAEPRIYATLPFDLCHIFGLNELFHVEMNKIQSNIDLLDRLVLCKRNCGSWCMCLCVCMCFGKCHSIWCVCVCACVF